MERLPETQQHVSAIYNDGFIVRHYARGARVAASSPLAAKRAAAIRKLGLTVRAAFNDLEDFEPLLVALVDSLAPRDDWPRF